MREPRGHKRLSWYYVVRATTCPALPTYVCGGRSRACLFAHKTLLLYMHVLNVDPGMHFGRSWKYRKHLDVRWCRFAKGVGSHRTRCSLVKNYRWYAWPPRFCWHSFMSKMLQAYASHNYPKDFLNLPTMRMTMLSRLHRNFRGGTNENVTPEAAGL